MKFTPYEYTPTESADHDAWFTDDQMDDYWYDDERDDYDAYRERQEREDW